MDRIREVRGCRWDGINKRRLLRFEQGQSPGNMCGKESDFTIRGSENVTRSTSPGSSLWRKSLSKKDR